MDILTQLPTGNKNVEIRNDRAAQRLPKDQRDVAQNGSGVDS